MDPCTPISSSDPSTSESSRLPSEEAIFPKDLVGQEVNPRKKVYVSQRSEELDNIENNNQHTRTAADDGWNEAKSQASSSTASKTSNEKTMKRRSYRGRHRQFQDQRRPPKPMKPFQQISSSRSYNGHSRMAPRLNLSKSLRAPYGSKWGVKTPQNRTPQSQYRPRTCPSRPSKFTFGSGSPSAVAGTKNWAKLVWESRFRKNVSDIQQAMDRQSDTPKSFLGYDYTAQNQWMQPSSSDTWGHSPKNMPSLFSPHCGVDRRHIMDMLGPIPMPITPPSPMSPLRSLALDPSLGLLDYTAGLNKIDTSPRNPDAVVMNTPTGQFVRGTGGKWFPITPMQQRQQKLQLQESRAYEEAVLEEAREKKQQADRDFGNWCKQRQARSEFVAAITKAAAEPQVVDGAVE